MITFVAKAPFTMNEAELEIYEMPKSKGINRTEIRELKERDNDWDTGKYCVTTNVMR